ncbi:MAG: hypothetical protein J7639_29255 [Paenibacillaceae bacterium]|nr:hypothetical protein [Paenibacillaceae bacterium]
MAQTENAGYISHSESTYYLKIGFHLEKMMMEHLAAIIPAMPDWAMKQALGLHQWQDSIHANELRVRTKELRGRPDKQVHPALSYIPVYLATAPNVRAMLAAIYESMKPRLVDLLQEQERSVFPVHDAPTQLIMRQICTEEKEQIASMKLLERLSTELHNAPAWQPWYAACDQIIGELLIDVFRQSKKWTEQRHQEALQELTRLAPEQLELPASQAIRPENFQVQDHVFAPVNPSRREELIWQFGYGYLQEMQAAETLGSIMYEIKGMPWEFYLDLSRHLWDEVRHSTIGEVRLKEIGVALEEMKYMTGNYSWRQEIDAARRYITLTLVIEAGSFPLRHIRLKGHMELNDYLSAQAFLYDAADETMHVQYGRKWAPELMSRYRLGADLEALVQECREANDKRTFDNNREPGLA